MSVRILTISEGRKMEESAKKFGEYFKGTVGKAKKNYICDNSNDEIKAGEYCVHAVLLLNADHPSRTLQESTVEDFITVE